MYARPTIDGQLLDFGVSGKLIMNALVMYDRQTGSLWSQILGQAVEGELEGTMLAPAPAIQTTWAAWRDLHPDTLALRKGGRGPGDPYESYYASPRAGILGEAHLDDRLATKTLVAGALVDGQPVAYPFPVLAAEQVVNDTVNEVPVLAVFEPSAGAALLFERRVDGRALTFHRDTDEADTFVLVDDETGSRWMAWSGAAFEGPLAGRFLERVPSTSAFWFGWKDFHPDTAVYGIDPAGT